MEKRKELVLEGQEAPKRKVRPVGPPVGERFLASMTWDVPLDGEDDDIIRELWRLLWEELDAKGFHKEPKLRSAVQRSEQAKGE